MQLNSYEFILAFLPLTFIGYFLLADKWNHRAANVWLLAASLFYYGYYDISYTWIILATIVLNYHAAGFVRKADRYKKLILVISITANIVVLAFFKSYSLLSSAIISAFGNGFNLPELILPLGISFFTFQQISFLVDTYRETAPEYAFLDYALYIAYFPKLLSGPIVKHDELIPQLIDEAKKKIDFENLAKSLFVFSIGLAEKVFLADVFGTIVDFGYENISSLTALEAVMTILGYTFQVYFDFAGYCDMAIGVSLLFNIDLPINFNSPYRSTNSLEFWKRWHITLTNFLTKYIYYPLGGNRKGTVRTYFNVMIVFLVSGLWHGAGVTFIIWGLLHGAASVITRIFKKIAGGGAENAQSDCLDAVLCFY